jgi:hypothetical protein
MRAETTRREDDVEQPTKSFLGSFVETLIRDAYITHSVTGATGANTSPIRVSKSTTYDDHKVV